MGTAFSNGLNVAGFFKWAEWERLFRLSWAFSNGLNGNGFFG
jgi:hypothetical protein